MLNPPQRAAVEYLDGPLLVLAGAGSGKTRVITEKIAWLLQRQHLSPTRIAAITFTNKAAREMRERVGKRIGSEKADQLNVCTFHALGLKFLHVDHEHAGLRRNFTVLDADDSGKVIKELAPAGIKPDALWQIRNLISQAKGAGLDPEQAAATAGSPREVQATEIYAAYQKRLAAWNAVDFDDLIRLPLKVLEASEQARTEWRERLRYLLVDEYQDTNEAQYRLLSLLAGDRGAFTCVGDDDQSIYAWRGARPENLDQLARDWPTLKVIKLEQNYRCGKRILRSANALIGNNPHAHQKSLWSDLPEGAPIRVLECDDSNHEAERIAAIASHLAERHEARWHDFAVLYRGNHQARALEKAMRMARVPYHLSGALSFLDRAEVKDLLAYLRLIDNPRDDAAFVRIVNTPRRGIGAGTLEQLGHLAQSRHASMLDCARDPAALKQLPSRPAAALAGFADLIESLRKRSHQLSPADLAAEIIERTGYAAHIAQETGDAGVRQRRSGNLDELLQWFRAMHKPGSGAGELSRQLALLSHADRDDPGNTLRLMTLHAAKGLEFRFVFIAGCIDGLLPHEGAIEEGRLDEERRLLYVGITRARELLTLSWASRSRRFGEVQANKPSRFLEELPEADIHWQGRDPDADAEVVRETAEAAFARMRALLGTSD
ncbi:MAG: UvrD-helicase domain-containing protein [Rhodanobacteraceae bacterium]